MNLHIAGEPQLERVFVPQEVQTQTPAEVQLVLQEKERPAPPAPLLQSSEKLRPIVTLFAAMICDVQRRHTDDSGIEPSCQSLRLQSVSSHYPDAITLPSLDAWPGNGWSSCNPQSCKQPELTNLHHSQSAAPWMSCGSESSTFS